MHKIPVTYQCWGCGSEKTVMAKTDLPIPCKVVGNLCKKCLNKNRRIKEVS